MKPDVDRMYDAVIQAWSRGELASTASALTVGEKSHRIIRFRLQGILGAGDRRRIRADTVHTIAQKVTAAGFKASPALINRAIGVFQVGMLYGSKEARSLPVGTVRAFIGTLRRDAKAEEWKFKRTTEQPARALWASVVSGEVDTGEVELRVSDLLGRKPRAPRKPVSYLEKVSRMLGKCTPEEQRRLYAVLHKRFGQAQPAPAPPEPQQPVKPRLFDSFRGRTEDAA